MSGERRSGGTRPWSDENDRPAKPVRSGAHLEGAQPLGPCAQRRVGRLGPCAQRRVGRLGPCAQRRVGRDDLASALQRGA